MRYAKRDNGDYPGLDIIKKTVSNEALIFIIIFSNYLLKYSHFLRLVLSFFFSNEIIKYDSS